MKALKSKKKLAILVKGRKKSKALYTAAKNVKLDKKSKLDGVHLYSFTDIGSKEEVGDDATIRTNINTSSETSSSRALSDQVYDIEFREILQIGSADSYFSTSLSSISLDGRDDSHSKPLQNSDSADDDDDDDDDDNGDDDGDSRDTSEPHKYSNKCSHGGGKPPQSPTSTSTQSPSVTSTDSSTKSQNTPTSSCSSSSSTKALKLKELRRTASNDSKNYVHVFHNQLTTLEEQPSKEDYDSDEYSSDNECIYGIGQRHSFMASFDEYELRMRWNHSLQVMAKRGLPVGQEQDREDSSRNFYGHDTPIRDDEGEI